MSQPSQKLTLYTNHGCGWSRRAQILLHELQLPYNEVLVDLDVPRPDWFLRLNPLGQVPVLVYNDSTHLAGTQIIVDSARIAWFLHDLFAGHRLMPYAPTPETLLEDQRKEVNDFVNLYFSTVNPAIFRLVREPDAAERDRQVEALARLVHDTLDARLPQAFAAGPFFSGCKHLTMTEVLVAPFVQILYDYTVTGIILPSNLPSLLDARADGRPGTSPFGMWAAAIRGHASCRHLWDPELRRTRVEQRLGRMRPGAPTI